MKKSLLQFFALLLFSCINPAISQTVPSSCIAPDSIVFHLYASDAQHLAERRVFADSSTYRDSSFIPALWTDTSMRALMAVYNAVSLPARDSVVSMFPVHTDFNSPALRFLDISAVDTAYWWQQFSVGQVPTGNRQVDSIMIAYQFKIFFFDNYDAQLEADTNYNMQAAANSFLRVRGDTSAFPMLLAGGGGDIIDSITATFTQLKYSFAWGDCPSGCEFQHYWIFRVYNDCSVQFIGSGGDSICVSFGNWECIAPTLDVRTLDSKVDFTLAPNPGISTCTLTLATTGPTTASIYDLTGREVMPLFTNRQISTFNFNTGALSSGLYFVRVNDEEGRSSAMKLIKE